MPYIKSDGLPRMGVASLGSNIFTAPCSKPLCYGMELCVALIPRSVNKKTPPEKNTLEHISFDNTKSGAGEQFLLLDCRARSCAKKECSFHRHRYADET